VALKPLSDLPTTPLKIKRALLSVSNKQGISDLAKSLHANGVEIISTGGTAKVIRDAGIPVKDVSEITSFPECLDGRVKTLHPKIHGGILARTSHDPDNEELQKLNIDPIELVVVNLYPFKEAISKENITPATATENIDIGGPTMVRAAAKNFAHVCILTHPDQYSTFSDELESGQGISFKTRRQLARKAFEHTADYDTAISKYFTEIDELNLPDQLNVSLHKSSDLRYGENPHQQAAIYGEQNKFINCFHGKELSYNNYLDIDSALNLMSDFQHDDPTIAIFKHTVPCGVASDDNLSNAYRKAFETDKMSPFGGIVIANRSIDLETAKAIDEIFTEIILAPSFDEDAKDLLTQKKNRRLVEILQFPSSNTELTFRSLFGGALVQQPDYETIQTDDLKLVTVRTPSDKELADMLFAWKVVKHVKSNAIVYAKNRQTLGIGTGQTSRVDSSEIAVDKAQKEGLKLEGSVIASDAFFPFADGVEAAAKAGATAVIQPGGSIRDEEVIQAANENNMTMIFTGKRHFKH
jgi:phosphoribosylaminoimidazolecarboxamide formyltransferase / IMP cyclohydrolase